MKKKPVISLAAMIVLLAGILVYCYVGRDTTRLSDITLTREDYQNMVWSGYRDDELPAGVVMDGELLTLDESTGTLYYSLNKGSDGAINPTVSLRDGGDMEVLYYGETFTETHIREGYRAGLIIIKAPDGGYRELHLVMTTLPIMNIDYSGPIEDYEYVDMNMSLYDNRDGVINRYIESGGQVKYRGASTLFYPKKSLRLSLKRTEAGKVKNNNISLLGMREDDDWIIYADYNDQERVRNVFSQNLWWDTMRKDNSRGVEAGLKYEFLELFVNGEYYGLCALGFPIDEKQLLMSGDYSKEALYKKTGWENERYLKLSPYGQLPGYSVKTDNVNENIATGEFGRWTDSEGNTYTDLKEWALLYEYYYYLAENRSDSEKLMAVHDEENLIDVALFFNLIQGEDNVDGDYIKNLYYAIKDTDDGPRALLVPWDMDISWGNHWVDDGYNNFTREYYYGADANFTFENGYIGQLLLNGDTDIETKLIAGYRELRKDKWSEENLMAMLDGYEADIFSSGAYIRDITKWPGSNQQDPDLELYTFREYVKARLTSMDEYIDRLEQYMDEPLAVRRLFATYGTENLMFFVIPGENAGEEFYQVTDALGIDREKLDGECAFAWGIYNYAIDYGAEFGDKTRFGATGFEKVPEREYWHEDEATLMVNDVEIVDMREGEEPTAAIYIVERNYASGLNLAGDYVPEVDVDSFFDDYLKELAEDYLNSVEK